MALKDLVEQSSKPRRQICREAGISQGYLSLLENGERRVGLETVGRLAKVLGVRPTDLRPDLKGILLHPEDDEAGDDAA